MTRDPRAQVCGRGNPGRPKGWEDWRWQMANRIRTRPQLLAAFPHLAAGPDLAAVTAKYPMAITPYYASLIRRADSSDPVFQMCVPRGQELTDPPFLMPDPLEECHDMPVPGMVHRYPDRALVIATTMCSTYCRHCTRKRIAGTRETSITKRRLEQIANYLTEHPQISDVIVSGGDPLTMSTEHLEMVLARLRQVPSVQIIRIGSRVPVVLPMRITDELCGMLRKYHPIWINTHFNHPQELTPESIAACNRLSDAGVPLGNQSVLLRGVNDRPQIIEQLCRALVRNRVRPTTCTSAISSAAWSTSARPCRAAWRSWSISAAGSAAWRFPPSWWTPRTVAARSPSCPTMWSARARRTRCCGITRAC